MSHKAASLTRPPECWGIHLQVLVTADDPDLRHLRLRGPGSRSGNRTEGSLHAVVQKFAVPLFRVFGIQIRIVNITEGPLEGHSRDL